MAVGMILISLLKIIFTAILYVFFFFSCYTKKCFMLVYFWYECLSQNSFLTTIKPYVYIFSLRATFTLPFFFFLSKSICRSICFCLYDNLTSLKVELNPFKISSQIWWMDRNINEILAKHTERIILWLKSTHETSIFNKFKFTSLRIAQWPIQFWLFSVCVRFTSGNFDGNI